MNRLFWLITGVLSLALGIIGIVIPLLPTVPLVLLAAVGFARSSSTLHTWLINHKFFGPIVQNWQQGRGMPLKAKVSAAMLMGVSIILSAVYLINKN